MDAIGPFTFIRLSAAPDRVHRMWEEARKTGIDGTALWNTGDRGEAFTVESLAVALTYAAGRTFLAEYQQLERTGPVVLRVGTVEQAQKYKVLKVQWSGVGVKRCARVKVGGDATEYQAVVTAVWTLLPIDPFVSPP